MSVYSIIRQIKYLYYRQAIYKTDNTVLSKKLCIANFDSDMDKRHYMIYRGYRLSYDGGKFVRFEDYVENQVRRAEELGAIPEVHISHAWYIAWEPMVYDIVIDLEKAPIRDNIGAVEKIVNYLKTYGLKPLVKISSIYLDEVDVIAGFHVIVNLATLYSRVHGPGAMDVLAKIKDNWSEFYNALLGRLEHIIGAYGASRLDKGFATTETHLVRAVYSPKARRGKPSEFLGYSLPVRIDVLKKLVERNDVEHVILYYYMDESVRKYNGIPWSGVENPKLFAALFKGLTDKSLDIQIATPTIPSVKVEELPLDPLYIVPRKGNKSCKEKKWMYIEKVLKRGLEDGRKRFILYCASRYLVNVKEYSIDKALEILEEFVTKSMELPGFSGSGKIYSSWIRSVLNGVKNKKLLPYSLKKLCNMDQELCSILEKVLNTKQLEASIQ